MSLSDLAHVVLDVEGNVLSRFDFGSLGLNPAVAVGLRRAFSSEFGHTSLESQRQVWRCLRKLAQYLKETESCDALPLPVNVALDFRNWLASSHLKAATSQSILNVVLCALDWCSRNAPSVVAGNAKLLVPGFKRQPATQRKLLDAEGMKKILSACYAEIEKSEERLKFGARLRAGDIRSAEEGDLADLIERLLRLGNGLLPTQKVLCRCGHSFTRRVAAAGGFRTLTRMLWASPEAIFPYYLALLVQTSGNPMAILGIERDCIKPHPLRGDIERLVWEKKRGKSEQRAEFPVGRQWSAVSLVRRLLLFTENIVSRCNARDRNKVFICLRSTPKSVGQLCQQTLHDHLDKFIDQNGLPNFDFRDLRRAGAVAHHLAAGTITAAQKRLNHRSVTTTRLYTSVLDRRAHHDEVIRKFQGEIVRASNGMSKERHQKATEPVNSETTSPTVFGFDCKNPFEGLAQGSRPGELCMQFQKCATCPGALIPLDDLTVVSRLVTASTHLNETRDRAMREGWWPRYLEMYETTRRILEEEILPAVDGAVLKRARESRKEGKIPWLE